MLTMFVTGLAASAAGLGFMARSVRVTARTARHAAGLF